MSEDDMNLPDPTTHASEPDDGVSPWWRGPGMWKIWLPIVLTVICIVVLYVKMGVALFT